MKAQYSGHVTSTDQSEDSIVSVPGIWAPRPRPDLDVHDASLGEVIGQVLHHEKGLLLSILHLLADPMELRNIVSKHLHSRVC